MDRTELKLHEDEIIWPNGLNRKPDGVRARRNVSVRILYSSLFLRVSFYLGCYYS